MNITTTKPVSKDRVKIPTPAPAPALWFRTPPAVKAFGQSLVYDPINDCINHADGRPYDDFGTALTVKQMFDTVKEVILVRDTYEKGICYDLMALYDFAHKARTFRRNYYKERSLVW